MAPAVPCSLAMLVERARSGDLSSRRRLFALLADENQAGAVLYTMARRILPARSRIRRLTDSADIVQSTLLTGLAHMNEFKGRSESEFFGWLRAILRSKVHRVRRRKEWQLRRDALERDLEVPVEFPRAYPLATTLDDRAHSRLMSALDRLSIGQRLVMKLRLHGFTTAQIARILGVSQDTVRKRESRATQRLRASLLGPPSRR